jgi:hypothetical protein
MKETAKEKIKNQLWRMGLKVSELSGVPGIGYDLLVDGKIRVAIFEGNKNVDCDIFAMINKGEKQYAVKADKLEWKKFTKIFGPKRHKNK